MRRTALLVSVALLSACGQRAISAPPPSDNPSPTASPIAGVVSPQPYRPPSASPSASPSPSPQPQRYEASGLVLQKKDGTAMLCLGIIATSLPPQCGGPPISNWDWDRVNDEQRQSGVTWGDYSVVGTYQDGMFTVLDIGPPDPHANSLPSEITIPCPEPDGGWKARDPNRMTYADLQEANQTASSQPDFSGLWIKHTKPPSQNGPDTLADTVLNVAFTGDLGRHRHQLEAVWGGPLCVVHHDHTMKELTHIQSDITEHGPDEFGIQLTFSNADVVHDTVQVGVIVADDATRAAVDQRYGAGTVLLFPALRPV